jgi:glycosyltransferase involved in cell wall biosynthesis/SAM-dependent methyltransferase
MRILTTLTYYHPHWTGLTTYACRIAEGLADRGHEVTVLTTRHAPSLAQREVVGGVRVVRLPVSGRVSRGMVMPRFPRALWELLGQHDLLQIHSPMPEAALAVRIAHARDRPVLVTHQGDVVMPDGAGNRAVEGAMNLVLRSAVMRADAVVTLSADYATHSRLLTRRRAPVHAITPPTTIPEPRPDAVEAMRAELGLSGRPLVGFAGRFVEEKGFDHLLAAIPLVQRAVPDAHFLFAGEVDVAYERFHERCRPLLDRHRDAVTSLGLVLDRQRLADFYAACDVFALPSRSDCFAGVQVEALLCGTPLVSVDIPGAREVVQRSGMGRLVRPGDPEALAEGIVAELGSSREPPERAAVLRLFDPVVAIEQYEQVARDLVARRPPSLPPVPTRTTVAPPVDAAVRRHLASSLRLEPDLGQRDRVRRVVELVGLGDRRPIVDCGSGFGAIAGALAGSGIPVVAFDLERDRVAAARDVGAALAAVADAQRLPVAPGSVSRALAVEVLEHVAEDDTVVAELWRCLRPGGVAVVTVPHANYPPWWDPLNWVRETLGLDPAPPSSRLAGHWSGHRRLYLPVELDELLTSAGFEVEVLEEHTSHVLPFGHLLVYGTAEAMIRRGRLPAEVRVSRRPPEGSTAHRILDALAPWLDRVERANERPPRRRAAYVTVVARARKPAAAR